VSARQAVFSLSACVHVSACMIIKQPLSNHLQARCHCDYTHTHNSPLRLELWSRVSPSLQDTGRLLLSLHLAAYTCSYVGCFPSVWGCNSHISQRPIINHLFNKKWDNVLQSSVMSSYVLIQPPNSSNPKYVKCGMIEATSGNVDRLCGDFCERKKKTTRSINR